MAVTPITIHVWIPNIFSATGGIQTYSSFFVQALQALYPAATIHICLLHDAAHANPNISEQSPRAPVRFHFAGGYPALFRPAVYVFQCLCLALRQRPHLIITTHLNLAPPARFLQWLLGVPYWVVAHGIEAWTIQRAFVTDALIHADRVLAVSHFTRDRILAAHGLQPQQVVVLPNTCDCDRFQIAPKSSELHRRYGIPPDHRIILTVARLSQAEQYKGYDRILQALPQIRAAMPNVHYLLVGQGDDQPRIEHLIEQWGLQHAVTLAGFVPDQDLCDHYNICDVFAMPSQGEGFGIVYLEAMACGKPCLGGNQDGAIDALAHGELGVLVHPDNISEIAQALIQMLQNRYPNPLFGHPQQLRQRMIEHFGFATFQQRLSQYMEGIRL